MNNLLMSKQLDKRLIDQLFTYQFAMMLIVAAAISCDGINLTPKQIVYYISSKIQQFIDSNGKCIQYS